MEAAVATVMLNEVLAHLQPQHGINHGFGGCWKNYMKIVIIMMTCVENGMMTRKKLLKFESLDRNKRFMLDEMTQ